MVFIAICDDSKPAREDVKNHLISYSIKHELEYLADEYESGECLLSSGKNYDLIFMDYEFEDKGSDGISIAKKKKILKSFFFPVILKRSLIHLKSQLSDFC